MKRLSRKRVQSQMQMFPAEGREIRLLRNLRTLTQLLRTLLLPTLKLSLLPPSYHLTLLLRRLNLLLLSKLATLLVKAQNLNRRHLLVTLPLTKTNTRILPRKLLLLLKLALPEN